MDTLVHIVPGIIQIMFKRLPWRSKGISQRLEITRHFIRELSYTEQNRTSGVFRLLISDIGVLLYFVNEVCRAGDLVEHSGVCAAEVDWTYSSWERNACTLCVVIWKLNTEQPLSVLSQSPREKRNTQWHWLPKPPFHCPHTKVSGNMHLYWRWL